MMQISHSFISINLTLLYLSSTVKIKMQFLTHPVFAATFTVEFWGFVCLGGCCLFFNSNLLFQMLGFFPIFFETIIANIMEISKYP